MAKIKRVPDKLRLYLRQPQKITRTVFGQSEFIEVKKGFMVDAVNDRTNETAKKWVTRTSSTWDQIEERYKEEKTQEPEDTSDNYEW